MPFSFSIAMGLACGLLTWGVLRVLLCRSRGISPVLSVILALSLVSLLL